MKEAFDGLAERMLRAAQEAWPEATREGSVLAESGVGLVRREFGTDSTPASPRLWPALEAARRAAREAR